MMPDSFFSLDLSLLQWFNSSNSVYFDSLVPILTNGLTWIPLYIALLYLVVKNNETMAQIGLIVGAALVCIILAGGVDDFIVKPMVAKVRPCNDPAEASPHQEDCTIAASDTGDPGYQRSL